ncbi:unnamed protein product [Linum trigynum]|uniref:Two-component response regulator n=1 Tax=Linum trigynum TaxID=586398 RepID=A0AAV2GX68_9ROSI
MKVEDVSPGGGGNSASLGREFFPNGLRVLAVDDDPVCLRLIGQLLRKCQYQVTVTNHALEALKMLRERRDEFDLVISDVNMPDMDGFKLLEHVEFEMDIPVIMLSGHSDKELVYKGVTHGAVDYLLKPVRMEELKNIWQHVVRKRRMGGKKSDSSSLTNKVERDGNGVVGGVGSSECSDANGKSTRKRKDQDDEEGEEDDGDSDGRGENEEGGNQKKPRVVWSVDLHKKFVHAVNQLGYDKAVPKKILDMMNVDGLTRENVASHLQKYRLYLKRMSCDKAMGIPFGSKDASSYLGIASSMDGFDEFRCLTTPGRLSTYQPGSLLGRLNPSSGLTLRGIASSGLLQPTNSQTLLNSSVTNVGQQVQQSSFFSTAQTSGLFSPSHSKPTFGHVSSIGGAASTSGNTMLLQHNLHSRGTFGAQSAGLGIPSSNRDSFGVGIRHGPLSPNLLDNSSRCNGSWENAIQLPKFPSNPLSEQFSHEPSLSAREFRPSSSSQMGNIDFSSASLGPPLAGAEMTGQVGLIGNVIEGFSSPVLTNSFGGMNSIGSLDQVPFDHGMDQGKSFDGSSSAAGQLSGGVSPTGFEVDKSQNGFITDSSSFDPLDDMVAAMMKREQNEGLIIDGDFGLDSFQIGSCI